MRWIFFNVFSYNFIQGNENNVLREPFSVVITNQTAEKYFGKNDPVGKIINYNNEFNLTVTGVINNIPSNTHFKFDFLASVSSWELAFPNLAKGPEAWTHYPFYTYILLQKDCKIEELEKKFISFVEKYYGDQERTFGFNMRLYLQPLTNIHLYSNFLTEFEKNGNITYVYIFSSLSFFLLLIACVNYMNLSTARFNNRIKEVGIRKIHGGNKIALFKQFIGESIILAFIGHIIAMILLELFLPVYNKKADYYRSCRQQD